MALAIQTDNTEFVAQVKKLAYENYLSDIAGVKVDVVPKKNIRNEFKGGLLKEKEAVWV